jgi:kynurenine formamidase
MVRSCTRWRSLAAVATLAGCGGTPALPSNNGFYVPDQGRIVNLSRSPDARANEGRATTLTAPAALGAERPNAGQIDPGRLIAPLIVIDVIARARQARDFTFGADDLTEFEGRRGTIPAGALVVLATGGGSVDHDPTGKTADVRHHPGFSPAVVDLLVRQRNVVGVGSDAPAIDPTTATQAEARLAALNGGRFVVTNLGGLDQIADGRAVAFVGVPLTTAAEAPVRVLALVARKAAQSATPPSR